MFYIAKQKLNMRHQKWNLLQDKVSSERVCTSFSTFMKWYDEGYKGSTPQFHFRCLGLISLDNREEDIYDMPQFLTSYFPIYNAI